MTQDKKIRKSLRLEEQDVVTVKAKEGCELPIRYRGKTHRVLPDAAVEFKVAELPYESKIHLSQALERGEIEIVTGEQ